MTVRSTCRAMVCLACTLAGGAAGAAHAQGRGGQNWTTDNGDAQRSSWMRADPRISKESVQKPGAFQLIWKARLDNQARQQNSLTQALLLNSIITYKGFKSLAFIGGSGDNVYSIDYDLNRMFWTRRLGTSTPAGGTPQCPGGLTAISRPTPLVQGSPGGRGAPPPPPPPARAGGPAPALNTGMNLAAAVYAIASDGTVHVLNPQTGQDLSAPVKLLAPNAKVVGTVFVDGVLYAATADNCGNVPNGVWAVDPGVGTTTVASWQTRGGSVVGQSAPTLGADGNVYVATSDGDIAALQAKTLILKDSFAAGSPFTSAPIAFEYKGRHLIVAANKDGRLYVLDGASLKSAPVKSERFTSGASDSGLASWEEADGTRWIAATSAGPIVPDTKFSGTNGAVTNGSLAAFRLVDQNGALTLQPAWTSRDISAPMSPIVVNGVVFVLAGGGPRAGSAVLYALDGATGKDLWNSGSAITSFVHSGGLSGADGQVYVPTYDNTLYAFGIPLEH